MDMVNRGALADDGCARRKFSDLVRRFQTNGGIAAEDVNEAAAAFAMLGLQGARTEQSLFAISSVKWLIENTGEAGDNVWTLGANAENVRKAYVYAVNDRANCPQAGYPAGYDPRYDDTNLTRAGKPPFGSMLIQRLFVQARIVNEAMFDIGMLNMMLANMDLSISVNGPKNETHLSSPIFCQGGTGVVGSGPVVASGNDMRGGMGAMNGPNSVRNLPKPIMWKMGDAGVDDELCVTFTPCHDTVLASADEALLPDFDIRLYVGVEGISLDRLSANG